MRKSRQSIMVSLRVLLLIAFAVIIDRSYGASSSSSSTVGTWHVKNAFQNETCISMQASLSFRLTYTTTGGTELSTATSLINVPIDANISGSSCNLTFPGFPNIPVQVLRLNFWGTWWTEFHFTHDKNNLGAPTLQQYFNLFQVVVHADYFANKTLFPESYNASKLYIQNVDGKTGEGALKEAIFGAPQHTFVCPSKEDFQVVDNPDGEAYIVVSNLKVQAFATSSDWMTSEICPQDQSPDDLIPVIVGGILAALVVVTLIGYLVYRSRLPPETLHMTNPNSHFEDVAFENKASVVDDEDSSDAESHPHISKHSDNKY